MFYFSQNTLLRDIANSTQWIVIELSWFRGNVASILSAALMPIIRGICASAHHLKGSYSWRNLSINSSLNVGCTIQPIILRVRSGSYHSLNDNFLIVLFFYRKIFLELAKCGQKYPIFTIWALFGVAREHEWSTNDSNKCSPLARWHMYLWSVGPLGTCASCAHADLKFYIGSALLRLFSLPPCEEGKELSRGWLKEDT